MYLMIKNVGIAAVQAFTVLGLSTARGDASKIGQFGSGSKHSVNLLLRNQMGPTIYLGNDKLTFHTKTDSMHGKEFKLVYYNFKGQEHSTGFALEFGEMDWDSIGMALREFISNAIDSVGYENIQVELVDDIIPFEGSTTVYIPANDQVKQYFYNLPEHFLHFAGLADVGILEKAEPSPAKIYRKGVFVRQVKNVSMFDYNFGDDVKIDESRNMDDNTCLIAASETLGKNRAHLARWIKSCTEERGHLWEDNFRSWEIGSKNMQAAFAEAFGDAAVCKDDKMLNHVQRNGHRGVVIKRNHYMFTGCSIPDGEELQGEVARQGVMECKTTAAMRRTFKKVWTKLENKGLTNGKPEPELIAFRRPMDYEGNVLGGFYHDGKVYINVDHESRISTHIEEIAHYVTGAKDGERAFQSYAFQAAAVLGF
jgi:hypothetical protein